jgi:hypothetical protein
LDTTTRNKGCRTTHWTQQPLGRSFQVECSWCLHARGSVRSLASTRVTTI